jgi:hypothetical protein
MAIVKKREVEIMAQLNGEELERHLAKLPAKKAQFDSLFNYLELKLDGQSCDHTSRFTMQYLMQKMMNFPKVSSWLSQNGGYCDCKILEEIAIPWREIFAEKEEN